MRNSIFTCQFIYLIAGTMLFAGTTHMVQADENRISVGTVNGDTIWLDDVMRQAERLPAKFRQAPMENYFDQLVTDMVDAKIAANAARAAKYDTKKEIAPAPAIEGMREQLVQTLSTQALGRVLEELRAKQEIRLRSFEDIRKDAMAANKQ